MSPEAATIVEVSVITTAHDIRKLQEGCRQSAAALLRGWIEIGRRILAAELELRTLAGELPPGAITRYRSDLSKELGEGYGPDMLKKYKLLCERATPELMPALETAGSFRAAIAVVTPSKPPKVSKPPETKPAGYEPEAQVVTDKVPVPSTTPVTPNVEPSSSTGEESKPVEPVAEVVKSTYPAEVVARAAALEVRLRERYGREVASVSPAYGMPDRHPWSLEMLDHFMEWERGTEEQRFEQVNWLIEIVNGVMDRLQEWGSQEDLFAELDSLLKHDDANQRSHDEEANDYQSTVSEALGGEGWDQFYHPEEAVKEVERLKTRVEELEKLTAEPTSYGDLDLTLEEIRAVMFPDKKARENLTLQDVHDAVIALKDRVAELEDKRTIPPDLVDTLDEMVRNLVRSNLSPLTPTGKLQAARVPSIVAKHVAEVRRFVRFLGLDAAKMYMDGTNDTGTLAERFKLDPPTDDEPADKDVSLEDTLSRYEAAIAARIVELEAEKAAEKAAKEAPKAEAPKKGMVRWPKNTKMPECLLPNCRTGMLGHRSCGHEVNAAKGILGLKSTRPFESELTDAYRRLAKLWHPDLHPNEVEKAHLHMSRLNQARDIMSKRTYPDVMNRGADAAE